MTFPQTSSILALQDSQEYWRLFTTLESAGDIFETESSVRAVVVGPQSDIARARIIYYDKQNPNIANELIVSVDKPFLGRLDALGSLQYQTGDRARLLISSADYGPPPVGTNTFRPPTAPAPVASPADPAILIVDPKIDLLFYLENEPAYVPPRVDRVHQFEQVGNTTGDQQWFLVPFFGRRFFDVCVKSRGITVSMVTTPAVDVYVYGINLSWILSDVGLGDGDSGHQQELLGSFHLNAPSAGAGVSDSISLPSRSFDYLAVLVQKPNGVNFPIETAIVTRISVSDKV